MATEQMPTEVWRFQNGTSDHDYIDDAVAGPNGTYVFVGTTRGNWSATNAGFADWVVFKIDAERDILWRWQNGTSQGDVTTAVAMAEDGSVIVVGHDRSGNAGFQAAKLGADGTLLWEWEGGTAEVDVVKGLAMADDGSVVLAGSTTGDWEGVNNGDHDLAALKLAANGTLLWRYQSGTASYESSEAAEVGEDGSFILTGTSSGNWSGLSHGSADFIVLKIDSMGSEVWRWQGGTVDDDIFTAVSIGITGSIFLAGYTSGNWSTLNAGLDDFAACKLHANGSEVWKWQDGTGWRDNLLSITAEDDESVIIAGDTWGGWSGVNFGMGDLAAAKLDDRGAELWRWQDGTSGNDGVHAIVTTGSSSEILLAGFVDGTWALDSLGGFDFGAVMLDTSTPTSAEPTPFPTHSPVASISPSPVSTPFSQTAQPPGPASGFTTLEPTLIPSTSSPQSTCSPTLAADGVRSNTLLMVMVVVLSCVLGLIGVATGWFLYRRRERSTIDGTVSPSALDSGYIGRNADGASSDVSPTQQSTRSLQADDSVSVPSQKKEAVPPATSTGSSSTASHAPMMDEGKSAPADDGRHHPSTPSESGETAAVRGMVMPGSNEIITSPGNSCQRPARSLGVVEAVLEAAHELARSSTVPGVAEMAGLVVVLVNVAKDDSDITGAGDTIVKRCRSVFLLVQRAAEVLDEIDHVVEPTHRLLLEDVNDAVADLVDIIKTYRSKGRISQVMVSTLFKRRQEEAEAVIEAAISRLHFGLQVQVAQDLKELGEHVRAGLRPHLEGPEISDTASRASLVCESRRTRRQRTLEAVEIPESNVTITDELLGKGGFGAVYIADYNGRNAAAKVVQVEHDLGKLYNLNGKMGLGIKEPGSDVDVKRVRRNQFLRELQAMIRLRSPHTVNVYGAITSREDRFVLVMELLPGGDLRAMLKDAIEPLAEMRVHSIIRDICAGMAFLHLKETVHGDLKSPNVLFDGAGRAKIADFGTSRWPRLTNSTGLATHTADNGHSTQMSFAWAAPEVLESKGTSYASDVYSFGIVMWEVVSRKLPWADEACPRDIYARVVFKGDRPEIPVDAPNGMAKVMSACWAGVPKFRPTFGGIMNWQKWH